VGEAARSPREQRRRDTPAAIAKPLADGKTAAPPEVSPPPVPPPHMQNHYFLPSQTSMTCCTALDVCSFEGWRSGRRGRGTDDNQFGDIHGLAKVWLHC
jgi:hypothetical protein